MYEKIVKNIQNIAQYTSGDTKEILALGGKIQKCANDFIREIESLEIEEKAVA